MDLETLMRLTTPSRALQVDPDPTYLDLLKKGDMHSAHCLSASLAVGGLL